MNPAHHAEAGITLRVTTMGMATALGVDTTNMVMVNQSIRITLQ
jgi:hypothetical protein